MAVTEVFGRPWTRKHDHPARPTLPAARIAYPKSLDELIELCASRSTYGRMTAAGSHWALSGAAVADVTFVETHDPNDAFPAMGRTLFDVVPGCLNPAILRMLAARFVPPYSVSRFDESAGTYFVHIESGKRIYQLYAELDQGDDSNPLSLAALMRDHFGNSSYLGPWAFPTLGGAGGQTVVGALTTGTHGGDFRMGPVADAVVAIHLVVDGGHHYWIEPESPALFQTILTDDARLRAVYEADRYKGREASGAANFTILRNDHAFNAVRICAGRFGIVYSVVLRVVRQYSLHQERRLSTWRAVRPKIGDLTSDLFRIDPPQPPLTSRFLQVAVCLTPTENFRANLAGVTKRWNVPLAANPRTGVPSGRAERVGRILEAFNAGIGGPRFELAGNSHPYSPDPANPAVAADPSFLERACMNADFIAGVIREVMREIEDFVNSNGAVIGGTLAAVVAAGGGAALIALIPFLLLILALLALFAAALDAATGPRLGNTLNDLKDTLLNRSDPNERAAGLLVWQMIAARLFSDQQGPQDYAAISYAMMDGHDYLDRSCNVNVDSIEVFFDATNPMLLAFVDALTVFEIGQETRGLAFVGYASLRFTGSTTALLGEERWPLTCVVEVAGLKDVTGTTELIDFATRLALDPNFGAILHWGQRNDSQRTHIQRAFGDRPPTFSGELHHWRNVLSQLTANGRLDGFSNAFSRRTGLEVVTPRIGTFEGPASVPLGTTFRVRWDCRDNPPGTTITLFRITPGGVLGSSRGLGLADHVDVAAAEPGFYHFRLVAGIALGGELREVDQTLTLEAV